MKKLFFETKMTWLRVIALAVFSAVLTAAVLIIPALANTSVSYLGVTLEAWFLFALIIIMNCKKPLEAGGKTFVFFLISQPLIYLLQIPFSSLGVGLFGYYKYWFIVTLLTFPGAMLAWLVKKDNLLSALILSVATGLIGVMFVDSAATVLWSFPGELIRTVFTLAEILVFIFVLLKKKRNRLVCGVITLAVILAFGFVKLSGGIGSSKAPEVTQVYPLDPGYTWQIEDRDGHVGEAEIDASRGGLVVTADRYSYETITLTNEQGETVKLYMVYAPGCDLSITEVTGG